MKTRTVLWGARRHDIQAGSRKDQYRQRLLNGETPTDVTMTIHVEGLTKVAQAWNAVGREAAEALAKTLTASGIDWAEAERRLRKAANAGVSMKEMAQQARNKRLQ